MILVDRRQGSGDLAQVWTGAQLSDLQFADVAILGVGHDHQPITVGIELKKLDELLADLHTGRFLAYQAPGMRRTYDYCWLVVEGAGKQGPRDELQIPRRTGWQQLAIGQQAIRYSTYLALLQTITQKAGIFVWRTDTRGQTLKFCQSLADWWGKGWDSHQSLDRFYQAPSGPIPEAHSLLRRWLGQLPGLGWKRSGEAEGAFTSGHDLANATVEQLAALKGISAKKAQAIYNLIRGEEE